ncbi:hypothetical protein [Pseudoalteromonas sp. BMB]|uniref:hypothetical protein n=1 Tax=Pseudoalteromonas sp. BMB TaxID=1874619 RepID=UPI001586B3AA|nr:hypothetical protein [Pseudoalteromonas sp. BMB]
MKKLTTAIAFLLSFGAHAVKPVYVSDELHQYVNSDFEAIHVNEHIMGYKVFSN